MKDRSALDTSSPTASGAASPKTEGAVRKPSRHWSGRLGIAALAYVLAMVIFFRTTILSGFDLGFGDRADGMIEIAILEHWRNVVQGATSWDRTLYFHPYADTLGYNDGYLLYGLVYSFWRMFADPFRADTLNILTFKTIGFVGAQLLVAKTLHWGHRPAALIALLWTIASSIWIQAEHAQLESVALLPIAMMLSIGMVRAECHGHRLHARILALGLASLMAAWLLTAYYMAWFTIFSGGLFVILHCLLSGTLRPSAILGLARRHAGTLLCGAAAFGLLVLPFLMVYLPKMHETGGQAYHEMLGYLVTPVVDVINVGPGNYLWGWIFRALIALVHAVLPADPELPHRVLRGEHEIGLPPILFVFVATAAWRIIVQRREGERGRASIDLRSFALMTTVAWFLTLQFWVASPWGLVFELVPGAKGLRVVSRYQIWLVLPLLLVAAAAWRERGATLSRSKPVWAAAIAGLLVAENLSAETPAHLSRTQHLFALRALPAPPSECHSFYVVASRRREPVYRSAEVDALYPHNVDAMLLAELWHVPTINGFSTFNPPDWNFGNPHAIDYYARVLAYAKRHRLRNLCRLDARQSSPWSQVTR